MSKGQPDIFVLPEIADPAVAGAFDAFPDGARQGLLSLRAAIFRIAWETDEAGAVQEALRWGQPAYLTQPKTGTTIRLGCPRDGGYALYVHCQTSLIADFQTALPKALRIEGNRAILFRVGDPLPEEMISMFIRNALTYHRKSK